MASDSLWDYIQWEDAALVTRKAPAAHAADALISAAQARCDGSLPDDTSALVLDVRPAVRSGEFFKRADRSPKKSGGPRWGRALSSALGALVCGGARTAGRADGGISDGDRLRVVAEVDGLDLVKATAGDESSRLEGLTPKSTEQSAKKVAHRPPRATPRTPIKGSRGPGRRPPTNRSKSRSSGSSGSSGSVDLLIMYGRSARRSTSCPDMALPDDVRKGSGSGDLSMSVECCKPVGGSGAVRASDRSLRSIAMKASHGDPGAAMFMARPQRGLGARASGTKGRAGGHDADKQSVSAQLATILKRLSAELKAGRH
ncbi:unnamed protein product [Ostreobium quekettii]|uniref:Uncharacterized protein n=1 Tax=Ostreobium quekettii TaxID=121088 RepID=A0A8S1IQQ2_9CHLO|nr:unnamed protein product [Ostreobium quekettii]